MASIERRQRNGETVYRVHYRTPAGAQRNKTFDRRKDAQRFLANVESAKNSGTYVDPALTFTEPSPSFAPIVNGWSS